MMIDMWYNDDVKSCDKIDCYFSDCDCMYRGNIYKNGKRIGDYSTNDSVEVENVFGFTGFRFR